MSTANFWNIVESVHPNYCGVCQQIGGYCGNCGGGFWQQNWDKVSVQGDSLVDEQNGLSLPIHNNSNSRPCQCGSGESWVNCQANSQHRG